MKTLYNTSLQDYHTFAVDCKADRVLFLESEEDIRHFIQNKDLYAPFHLLGGGSNVLFISDFQGTLAFMRTRGIDRVDETDETVLLSVAAGEPWENLVAYCARKSYYGIENLAAIPGLAGSSPVQNIGAYGMEVKEVIHSVEGYSLDGNGKKILTPEDCHFGYRSSLFKKEWKGKFIISSVTFRLSKREQYNLSYDALRESVEKSGEPLSLSLIVKTVTTLRNSKLPDTRTIGSAGSFFKNPILPLPVAQALREKHPGLLLFPVDRDMVKLSAGQLIERAGWKGYRKGDAGVYPHQALVIVNYGKSTGRELEQLYQQIIEDVSRKFDLVLEPEVNIIG